MTKFQSFHFVFLLFTVIISLSCLRHPKSSLAKSGDLLSVTDSVLPGLDGTHLTAGPHVSSRAGFPCLPGFAKWNVAGQLKCHLLKAAILITVYSNLFHFPGLRFSLIHPCVCDSVVPPMHNLTHFVPDFISKAHASVVIHAHLQNA